MASVHKVVEVGHTERQTSLLVRLNGQLFDPAWEVQDVSLEEIVLAYMGQSRETPKLEYSGLMNSGRGREQVSR